MDTGYSIFFFYCFLFLQSHNKQQNYYLQIHPNLMKRIGQQLLIYHKVKVIYMRGQFLHVVDITVSHLLLVRDFINLFS